MACADHTIFIRYSVGKAEFLLPRNFRAVNMGEINIKMDQSNIMCAMIMAYGRFCRKYVNLKFWEATAFITRLSMGKRPHKPQWYLMGQKMNSIGARKTFWVENQHIQHKYCWVSILRPPVICISALHSQNRSKMIREKISALLHQ